MMACIAGFVDVFGFVCLSHLFTAHITGNIVIAIAELINHTPGVAAKLIALPVFMVVAMLVTWVIEYRGQTKVLLVALLRIEALLLSAFMIAGFWGVPTHAPTSWEYIGTGMLAVSAMAIHNTLLRTFMAAFPPCTVMTGNFCQLMVDFVSYSWGKKLSYPVETLAASSANMRRFGNVFLGFCLGGLIAAIGVTTIGFWMVSVSVVALLWMSLRVDA
jgi:uncharacterized membrane protein YoaK (UPF0700 family)